MAKSNIISNISRELLNPKVSLSMNGHTNGTLPTAGYCKGSPCNEKRNLISMNWIFYAKLVNRMKQESVR